MIITYEIKVSPKARKPLTSEEIMAIESQAPRDEEIVYDDDCPEMTDEQLKQFKRVHPNPDKDASPARRLG